MCPFQLRFRVKGVCEPTSECGMWITHERGEIQEGTVVTKNFSAERKQPPVLIEDSLSQTQLIDGVRHFWRVFRFQLRFITVFQTNTTVLT